MPLPSKGYTFVATDESGPLAAASPGRRIAVDGRGPPWIVVMHDPRRVSPKWPGRLWAVEIVDAATDWDMLRHGGRPNASAGYTRAVAVKVIEEVPPATMFGVHGRLVVDVIHRAEHIDRDLAQRLAVARADGSADAYGRAWQAWIANVRPDLAAEGRDLRSTLEWYGSPINNGFLTIHDLVYRRAKRLEGDAAIGTDDIEDESWLLPPWSHACDALCEAAMAFGAPEFVAEADQPILANAYVAVFGAP